MSGLCFNLFVFNSFNCKNLCVMTETSPNMRHIRMVPFSTLQQCKPVRHAQKKSIRTEDKFQPKEYVGEVLKIQCKFMCICCCCCRC